MKLFVFSSGPHGHGQGATRLPLLEGVADGFGSSGEDFGQGPLFSMRRAISGLGHLCFFQSSLAVRWIYLHANPCEGLIQCRFYTHEGALSAAEALVQIFQSGDTSNLT